MSLADRDGFIWLNGKFVPWREAQVHVLCHGLHYGTGVFEGVRAYHTAHGPAVFRLPEHTRRLFDSAHILGLPVRHSYDEIFNAQLEVVALNKLESAYIRPIMFMGPESLGLDLGKSELNTAIAAWPWGTYLGEKGLSQGIRVCTSSFPRHHPAVTMCRAKSTGHYVNSVLAHAEAVAAGYEEAMQMDTEGYVAEGPGENLFIVKNGQLKTPALHSALSGVTRMTIIELAADLGMACEEKRITRDEVYIADEAFFTGTAAEVTPIREIDGRVIGSGSRGPVTNRLQKLYFDCVTGTCEPRSGWLTAVRSGGGRKAAVSVS